jgi:hypothetical protein
MTKENRELLLKEIGARLQYGVKILHETWNYEWDQELSLLCRVTGIDEDFVYYKVIDEHTGEEYKEDKTVVSLFDDKLFLRPMSSMTDDEKKEFEEIKQSYHFDEDGYILQDWLNANHFDYRGLIPKGLALEAKEGMYKL